MNNSLIKSIIISQKNFHLLPRNEDAYCIYDGNLSLNKYNIKKLPNKFKINGNFYCSDVGLEELPKGLIVEGEFNCYKNKLTKLPKDLVVLDHLYCFKNKLKDIPTSIVVTGNIYCYDNEMPIFRIINGNTKIIYDSVDVRKLSKTERKKGKKEKRKTKKIENLTHFQKSYLERKEEEDRKIEEQKKIDNIKLNKLSDKGKEIYKRVIKIRDTRKDISKRYTYYY